MTKCAIHQPHYFPWLGYLNKMASVDVFIILDEAQIEKGSNMYRNKLCTLNGQEKYITIAYEKKNCLDIPFKSIHIDSSTNWQERQINFIENNYKKTPYYTEVFPHICTLFEKKYEYLDDAVEESIRIEKDLFDIKTKIVLQSELQYDRELKRNELLIDLCQKVNADFYLSGNGARKYMDLGLYKDAGIEVEFQRFTYPEYLQGHEFVPNLSALDLLFNCGIEESKKIFWENLNAEK